MQVSACELNLFCVQRCAVGRHSAVLCGVGAYRYVDITVHRGPRAAASLSGTAIPWKPCPAQHARTVSLNSNGVNPLTLPCDAKTNHVSLKRCVFIVCVCATAEGPTELFIPVCIAVVYCNYKATPLQVMCSCMHCPSLSGTG